MLAAATALALVAWAGTTLPASAASSLFGDAQMVASGGNTGGYVEADSDADAPGYGGVSFDAPATVNDLNTLGVDYKVLAGDCGGGAPRFAIGVGGGKTISVYLGTAPNFNSCSTNWTSSGNVLSDADLRVDTSQLAGGTFYDTWAHAKQLVGTSTITDLDLVVDASWATGGTQRFGFDNAVVNGTTYTFEQAPPAATSSQVTIVKYVDGAHATAANASSTTFNFTATYNASNIGAGSDPFTIGPTGNNTPNAYEAMTIPLANGASYNATENTSSAVGNTCADGKPFAINGYSSGTSLANAQAGTVSSTSPTFTNLQENQYVIVWNRTCEATSTPPSTDISNACATPNTAPAGYTLRKGTTGGDSVTLAPNTMFVGRGGNDHVQGGNGNYIVCLGSGNDHVSLGNGDSVVDVGGGNNQVTLGNGTMHVKAGAGNDQITTGSGDDTVNAGGGNNQIRTNAGNDSIKAGAGNDSANAGAGTDTCALGGGNNSPTSCEL